MKTEPRRSSAPARSRTHGRRPAAAPRKPAPGDEANRRRALIREAARLFREKGFEGTTVRDIARAVGMRSGSPFYHFDSKEDLLFAVMEEGLIAGLEATQALLARDLSPRDKFHALVRSHLDTLFVSGADFIPVLLYEWRSLSEPNRARIVALKDRYDAIWQQMVRELCRAGLIATDSRLARLLLLGAINYMATWYRPGGELSLDQVAGQAAEFFLATGRSA